MISEETQKTGRLIAVYARVSTENQEKQETIQTQLAEIKKFAHDNGHTIVQEYPDDGWSGVDLARPGLDQLRMDAKKKIWDAVLIYDPDRLSRNYAHQKFVMDELLELGIETLFVTTPPAKTDEERIIFHGIKGLFAEYERIKIAERFRIGKLRKAREGHVIATEAPYGYTFIKKKGKPGDNDFHQGYYEINEREAQIVKNLFSWVADEGLTLRGVVRRLQDRSIPPRKSKRGVWNTSTLSSLLRNKTYIGEGYYGVSYAVVPVNPLKRDGYKQTKKTSRRLKPENEWIMIPTPKLIDTELFERVGRQLKANFDFSMKNRKNEYLLAGKIWCPCGRRRAGEGPMHGKHLYYRCTNRVYSFPLPSTCNEKGINARITDALVWQKITRLMSSPELLVNQAKRWLNDQNNKTSNSTINIEATKREIAKLKEQANRYAKAYGAAVISMEQLKEYTLPLKATIASLEGQIAKAKLEQKRPGEPALPRPDEIRAFAQKAAEKLYNLGFKAKQEIVRNVVDKVVGTQTEVVVSGYIPVKYFNHVEFYLLHRHCRPAQRRQINSV